MHFANQVALVIFLLMLIAVAAGCSEPPVPKTSTGAGAPASSGSARPEAAGAPQESAGQKLDKATDSVKQSSSDAALTAKVKAALAEDVGLKTLKIDVNSNGGVVSLKGEVDSTETKQRVQQVVQGVQGVTWVQNQISIAVRAG